MKSVVFDFDFTLADSSPAVIECVTFALEKLGLRPSSATEIRHTIGIPLPAALARLHGPQTEARTNEFVRFFFERADLVMAPRTRIYEGVPGVLTELRARGHRLGIVSTKRRRSIEEILDLNGLRGAVDVIVGGDDTPAHKPDPSGLLSARRQLLGAAGPAIYVGDHPVDGQAAMAAGFGFIAVLTGVHDADAFADYDPIAVLEDLARLPEVLA
jgi:phosphoglycolate phosphatase